MTGGSRGLGRAIVELLIERGETVAFTYRSDAGSAGDLVAESGELAHAFELDLADREAAKPLVQRIEEEVGAIAGLVNNAGMAGSQLIAMTGDAAFEELLEVNLGGAFRLMRAVAPLMVRRRRGSIVNVASLGAIRAAPGQGAYAASKAGLISLTRTLAREIGRRGVRVNAVVPGFVTTDMTRDLPERAVAGLRANEALPRGVEPRDVAEAVHFLLSDRSQAITGQSLVVDAGASI